MTEEEKVSQLECEDCGAEWEVNDLEQPLPHPPPLSDDEIRAFLAAGPFACPLCGSKRAELRGDK
ncbi:hypothetical protein LCGC14_1255450 [marine sediment metagenome]|uniref:Uncharacterized protein n=1 Tax=marine sediment metagenome TaxID=412755 RepID=A0A0F9NIZ3_9ZZZZ